MTQPTPFPETRRAFDAVAPVYASTAGRSPTLQAMRDRSIDAVRRWAPAPARVLEIGCGPGLDAVRLGHLGYVVHATDVSPGMVAEARALVEREALTARVTSAVMPIERVGDLGEASAPDVVYSSLGALNCVDRLDVALADLGALLRPGGIVVASIMGRWCPWEISYYLSRGDWRRALVRARRPARVPMMGHEVRTLYYAPKDVARAAREAGFVVRELRALGLVVPPPYLSDRLVGHRRMLTALLRVEDCVAAWPGLRHYGDHFLVVLQRQPGRAR